MTTADTRYLRLNTAAHGLKRGVLGATAHRVMLTTQGCSHVKCPGCTSPHTWDANAGRFIPVAGLITWMKYLPRVDGLTVTGGEPTDQAPALMVLLRLFRQTFPDAEVVLYSAQLWSRLQKDFGDLVALCDVVVAGPYVQGLPPTPLAGSSNQTVHLLTPLAERLYVGWEDWPLHKVQLSQVSSRDTTLVIGIPSRAMKRSTSHLLDRPVNA